MASAGRGNEDYTVEKAEGDYAKLIRSANAAPSGKYEFSEDALEVRDRINDYLHKLELVDGFSPALIGAIGKLKGYFARLCLVLHVARKHDPIDSSEWSDPEFALPASFTAESRERVRNWVGPPSNEPGLSAGMTVPGRISRRTAEAAERIVKEFILPHIIGLYDVVASGGQDRAMLRSIGDFVLSSSKDRLRPSDVTAGLRALRGQPEHKIREWMGRFCAMGWLEPEEEKPGVPPKAWRVVPGLREYFAARRKQAQEARTAMHAILKAGRSRKEPEMAF